MYRHVSSFIRLSPAHSLQYRVCSLLLVAPPVAASWRVGPLPAASRCSPAGWGSLAGRAAGMAEHGDRLAAAAAGQGAAHAVDVAVVGDPVAGVGAGGRGRGVAVCDSPPPAAWGEGRCIARPSQPPLALEW